MDESDYEQLRILEAESCEFQMKRQVHYYEHETPGWLDEHNRQIEIARLQRQLNPPD